jgi:homoserine dehydrogenase
MSKQLTIGLFGFGVVGEGLYKVLQQTPSLNASVKKVVIRHPEKKRSAPPDLFTTDASAVLNDPLINVVVELIDDADAAFAIISTALLNGKAVVSANKKCIAEHLDELLSLQERTGSALLYEAAACASIPVIRNLEEYYDNDLLRGVAGIVNGSTNFILSRMIEGDLSFKDALLLAQQLGFAESDPSLDVDGIDAVNKLAILLLHSYGVITRPGDLLHSGIRHITRADIGYAEEKGCRIKLVARAVKLKNDRVNAFVLPQFINQSSLLHNVNNEYNGVTIRSGLADEQFFYGKGAGGFPTASAVLSDLSALRYNYRYEYRKKYREQIPALAADAFLKVYVSFDQQHDIPETVFEWIEESHSGPGRSYIIGAIAQENLLKSDWWRQPGVSLILTAEPFVEDLELRSVKRRSLQLAGVV